MSVSYLTESGKKLARLKENDTTGDLARAYAVESRAYRVLWLAGKAVNKAREACEASENAREAYKNARKATGDAWYEVECLSVKNDNEQRAVDAYRSRK